MSISVAVKVGVGLTLVAGVPFVAYLSWDHITLYEVEREVISKKIKLEKKTENESDTNKMAVIIKTSDTTSGSETLSEGYSWSCEITIEPKQLTESGSDRSSNLWEKLKNNLPVDSHDQHLRNKELLVRACSKKRANTPSNQSVLGKLRVKEVDSSKKTFLFEKNPELNVLLGNS